MVRSLSAGLMRVNKVTKNKTGFPQRRKGRKERGAKVDKRREV
jgi:hypothetical protein